LGEERKLLVFWLFQIKVKEFWAIIFSQNSFIIGNFLIWRPYWYFHGKTLLLLGGLAFGEKRLVLTSRLRRGQPRRFLGRLINFLILN